MSKLLRYFARNQTCFITAVTANRRPILHLHPELLGHAVRRAARRSRFKLIAWVILPEHFHAILISPDGDVPKIIQRVKLAFSLQWQRLSEESGPVWQHRYWDHVIRSEQDLVAHADYVHYNPVKHGLADSPGEWRLSSFRRYVRSGHYGTDWGERKMTWEENTFGE